MELKGTGCVRGIGGLHRQGVGPFPDGIGDVEGERQVAAGVFSDLGAVDPDGGLVINRLEMEKQAFPRGFGGGDFALIPDGIFRGDTLFDSGKGRLDGEGNKDVARPFGGHRGGVFRGQRVFPKAIQIGPLVAGEGGPGILAPSLVGRDFGTPFGEHGIGSGLPGLDMASQKGDGEESSDHDRGLLVRT